MQFLLGSDGNQASVFSKFLARKPSHITSSASSSNVRVLNESTFQDLLPAMDNTTPILIESGYTAGSHQKELFKTIKERDIPIIMKNCCIGDLSGYAAVNPTGEYVVVKSSSNGSRQHIWVYDKEQPQFNDDMFQVTKSLHSGQPTSEKSAKFKSCKQENPKNEPKYKWIHETILEFERYYDDSPTAYQAPEWVNERLKNGHVKAFSKINISIYATEDPPNKWIQFKLTDAVGMSAKMGSDDSSARGLFNNSAEIYLFPGRGRYRDNPDLPEKWSNFCVEPKTPNRNTTYSSTTGWTFGVTVDANGPKVKAGYNASTQEQHTIGDFSVRNKSDGAMSGWEFYYTAIDGDKWSSHFTRMLETPKPIADLAKSTLHLNAETLYKGPPDSNEKITWNFQLFFNWAALYVTWKSMHCHHKHKSLPYETFTIDTGVVDNPENVNA